MSKNCNYVYVQGLRFRPEDVTLLWKDAAGAEHSVKLRKTGTGRVRFNDLGVPVSLTPKDLRTMLRKGETVNVIVHAMSHSDEHQEKVMLRLDPHKAEGRKGRRSFDPVSLAGLPQSARIALALEQLKTAPYGEENRAEALARLRWSLENLPNDEVVDEAIESMLSTGLEAWAVTRTLNRMLKGEQGWLPSPTRWPNVELATLLLSDTTLVASLIRENHRSSIRALLKIAPLTSATLADSPRQAAEVLAAAAAFVLEPVMLPPDERYERLRRGETLPPWFMHAVRYVTDQSVLSKLASYPDLEVRLAAAKRITDQAVLNKLAVDGARAVRIAARKRSREIHLAAEKRTRGVLADIAAKDPDPQVRARALGYYNSI